MATRQFSLLASRRFLPLFIAQALGAFNDNVFKNALVILITYVLAERAGMDGRLMVTAAAGIFILPFFLFSATAGQLADRYDKAMLIRRVKLLELVLMLAAAAGFWLRDVTWLMLVLFLMGSQSALFGPLKYGILPEQLQQRELVGGNGLIQAATFLAILLGTLVGGLLVMADGGIVIISGTIVAIAAAGWFAARFIPPTPPAAPDLAIDPNFLRQTWRILVYSAASREIFVPVLGVSWFWLVGATFLAQVPTYGKLHLGGDEGVVTLLLLAFSVGIGIGSLVCERLLRGEVSGRLAPFGALGISLFTLDLYLASNGLDAPAGRLIGAAEFIGQPGGWRVLLDVLLIAVAGGIYVVPLNAMIQARSPHSHLARNIAALNIMNSLFMVVSALLSGIALAAGMTIPGLFLALGVLNLGVTVYAYLYYRRVSA
ncbi:MAG TPA: MFS transporter [Sedimenticola thiotaurini]|uniref:MFS transporter n=1 Tax=Sedimenticola thiotaurini TaxID=1543721 RepID=A0A831W5D0_9GAMM|nr:MFS transporter [Sedimenticola thiotaurini]